MLLLVSVADPVYRPVSEGIGMPGSILCVLLTDSAVETLAEAVAFRVRNPWAPAVIIGSSSQVAARVLLDRGGSSALWMTPSADGSLPHAREIAATVTQREPVSKGAFVAYLAQRAGERLGAAVARALGPERLTRGVRSQLRRCGPFGAYDWARAHLLLTYLSETTRAGLSQEAVALHHGVTPRSLSVWTKRFLGCNWRAAVDLGSWEARLEIALRAAGYLPGYPGSQDSAQSA